MRMLVPNAQEIRRFLKGDYKVLEVVLESEKVIKSIFGDVPLEMLLSQDYGAGIFIHIKYEGEDAMSKMEKFDKWYMKNLKRVDGKLNFLI